MTTNIDKKRLRSAAHALKPTVFIGQQGLTAAVLSEILTTIDHHELIKIRIRLEDRSVRKALAAEICSQTEATLIQLIGQVATVYKAKPV